MISYKIRSVALLNVINDVKNERLIPDAYFQRNLVWRDIHKKDFIETILLGYPFPQMFFSRGKIDLNKMDTVSCIVDGQQRTSTIVSFVNNEFSVSNKYFRDLSEDEKSEFLKYEIGIVELDLENDDPKIKEIFQRLNRTSNSLTSIEKLASEFAPTEYMFTARLLANDVDLVRQNQLFEEGDEDWRNDPNVPADLIGWAKLQKPSNFESICRQLPIFTERETARKVHLMYVLNIMSTIVGGFFNRNEKTTSLLEDYKEEFPEKDKIYNQIIKAFETIEQLNLDELDFWTAKANFFSLSVAITQKISLDQEIDINKTIFELKKFSSQVPEDYALAAREGVNNRKERILRNSYVEKLVIIVS